jgi:hypothetical protein
MPQTDQSAGFICHDNVILFVLAAISAVGDGDPMAD